MSVLHERLPTMRLTKDLLHGLQDRPWPKVNARDSQVRQGRGAVSPRDEIEARAATQGSEAKVQPV